MVAPAVNDQHCMLSPDIKTRKKMSVIYLNKPILTSSLGRRVRRSSAPAQDLINSPSPEFIFCVLFHLLEVTTIDRREEIKYFMLLRRWTSCRYVSPTRQKKRDKKLETLTWHINIGKNLRSMLVGLHLIANLWQLHVANSVPSVTQNMIGSDHNRLIDCN